MLDRCEHLLLPDAHLGVLGVAIYSRYQRNLMLDTLHADYVRTARAKGLHEAAGRVQARPAHGADPGRHAVRLLASPPCSSGATFTETLFGWHGMGEYLVTTSINGQDVNGAVAVAAFGAVTFFLGAVLSEIFVVLLDPRVRVS